MKRCAFQLARRESLKGAPVSAVLSGGLPASFGDRCRSCSRRSVPERRPSWWSGASSYSTIASSSTTATPVSSIGEGGQATEQPVGLGLSDTARVFRTKSTSSLAFSLAILRLCSLYEPVSRYGPQFLDGLGKAGLGGLSNALMRGSFFRHFCAGESLAGVEAVVRQYERSGVRCIFDFSVEDAMTPDEWRSNTDGLINKIRDYAATYGDRVRFVPLKITGLCSPVMLERMSSLIYDSTAHNAGWMDGIRYVPCAAFPVKGSSSASQLDQTEIRELNNAIERLSAICTEASKANFSLLFDAEQTPRQPAINWITRKLSKRFNKDKAIVLNTYQMYLKDNLDNLERDLAYAREEGFILGAKIVRGAYIFTETQYATAHGLPLPIQETKGKTDIAYDAAIALLLRNIDSAALVVATHNAGSVEKAIAEIRRLGLDKSSPRINFAQLMGMCEDLTLSLGQLGFNAHKLLPYGPLENVMPYLIRRVQENSSVLGGTARERQLITKELKRRLLGLNSS